MNRDVVKAVLREAESERSESQRDRLAPDHVKPFWPQQIICFLF